MSAELMTPETKSSADDEPQLIDRSNLVKLASFAIPVALVVGLFVLLLTIRNSAEATVANVAGLLPVGFAFAAGMVASVNPCGFFMLPAYISYHLGTEEEGFYQQSTSRRLSKGLLLGAVTTVGFLVVFAVVGGIISAGGQWLVRVFPYAGIGIGGVMIAVGLLRSRASMNGL